MSPTPPPAPPPPPAAGALLTLSGIARDFSGPGGSQPVPNLRLHVRAAGSSGGVIGGADLPDIVTDAEGRYTIAGVVGQILFFQVAQSSTHRFLCDWFPVWLRPPGSLSFADLPVVSRSWSGQEPPDGIWLTGGSAYGTVTETIEGSAQPVAGATMVFVGGHQYRVNFVLNRIR